MICKRILWFPPFSQRMSPWLLNEPCNLNVWSPGGGSGPCPWNLIGGPRSWVHLASNCLKLGRARTSFLSVIFNMEFIKRCLPFWQFLSENVWVVTYSPLAERFHPSCSLLRKSRSSCTLSVKASEPSFFNQCIFVIWHVLFPFPLLLPWKSLSLLTFLAGGDCTLCLGASLEAVLSCRGRSGLEAVQAGGDGGDGDKKGWMFPLLPLLYLTSWSVTPFGYFAHWEWPHLVPVFLYSFVSPPRTESSHYSWLLCP